MGAPAPAPGKTWQNKDIPSRLPIAPQVGRAADGSQFSAQRSSLRDLERRREDKAQRTRMDRIFGLIHAFWKASLTVACVGFGHDRDPMSCDRVR